MYFFLFKNNTMKNNRKNLHVYNVLLSPHMVCDASGKDSELSFSLAQSLPRPNES